MNSLITQLENPDDSDLPVVFDPSILTLAQFRQLAEIPPEIEWFANIDKVQEWLGHVNIATTWIYDHRKTRPEDSPTFKVSYK